MAPQTYLVTGASSGLGLEIVRQLAARGDKVFATVRKRKSSGTGEDYISKVEGDVTIIEGVDVMNDKVKEILQTAPALSGVSLDVIVHNAGGLGGDRAATMSRQTLENITADQMLSTFQLNTLGPLRVQQALQPLLKSPGGKICFISTGTSSRGDLPFSYPPPQPLFLPPPPIEFLLPFPRSLFPIFLLIRALPLLSLSVSNCMSPSLCNRLWYSLSQLFILLDHGSIVSLRNDTPKKKKLKIKLKITTRYEFNRR